MLAQEGEQKPAHFLGLLLVGPVADAVHHVDPAEMAEARHAYILRAADRPVGAPVLAVGSLTAAALIGAGTSTGDAGAAVGRQALCPFKERTGGNHHETPPAKMG
jgi:hypothetical protein